MAEPMHPLRPTYDVEELDDPGTCISCGRKTFWIREVRGYAGHWSVKCRRCIKDDRSWRLRMFAFTELHGYGTSSSYPPGTPRLVTKRVMQWLAERLRS